MRILIPATLFIAVLCAGCNSAPPPPAVTVAPVIANAVSGTVTLREPRELSAAAKLDIKVYDAAQPTTVLAQATIPNANQPPVAFNLPIDVSKVDPKRTYAVDAILTDGDRRFLQVLQYAVLTNKAPSKIDVLLAPEPTPSEKMFEEYRKAYALIGTLKSIRGSSLNDKSTTAWDAFLSNGKVKVVREITDLDDDKGRIAMKMAFQGDDPWIIVRDESPAGSNKSFATTKLGWDETGKLVLNEKSGGDEVSDAEAKALYAHAQSAYRLAQSQAPAPKK